MLYGKVFFEYLIGISLIGLAVDFVFQVWYFVSDIKEKTLW